MSAEHIDAVLKEIIQGVETMTAPADGTHPVREGDQSTDNPTGTGVGLDSRFLPCIIYKNKTVISKSFTNRVTFLE